MFIYKNTTTLYFLKLKCVSVINSFFFLENITHVWQLQTAVLKDYQTNTSETQRYLNWLQ